MSSVHDKLGRVRKPRVHIRYDVQVGDATEKKELPFLMGVIGDFSGKPMRRTPEGEYVAVELKELRERKFVDVNRDNINAVLKQMSPGFSTDVENTLKGDGSTMKVNLAFESMKDFDPAQVANQVPALKKLLEIREQLSELKTKADVSSKLESTLEEVLKNADNVKALAAELGIVPDKPDSSS
ncbi:MAG: type VI secretion system contractile sheath small subunit [Pirellula sp.]